MMKDKRIVIVSILSLLIVFGWFYANQWMRVSRPEWFIEPTPQTAEQAQSQTQQQAQPSTRTAATQPGAFYAVGGERKAVDLGNEKFDP
jgi:hypothetical protein